ncbi:LutC/YkgG family protein [Rubrolithibacter danxiaensis]|uniref:LutC/YkgG family protein n=1 Tax=Rubrolithibacter danxiaensis TaxID=3390805 RepID=UPI003BF91DBA
MSSRDKILEAIRKNQPEKLPLPELFEFFYAEDLKNTFTETAISIGSSVIEIETFDEIKKFIRNTCSTDSRIVSTLPELKDIAETDIFGLAPPHLLGNVDLAILNGDFAVAENSAVWITEESMKQRVLPFITQHLALIIDSKRIVSTMQQAYKKIGTDNYGFGTFIAGPSKTADIEQSLVLGAHGPRSLTIFLLK